MPCQGCPRINLPRIRELGKSDLTWLELGFWPSGASSRIAALHLHFLFLYIFRGF